jgi:drug/metabolite transporter (DMT)-like permease
LLLPVADAYANAKIGYLQQKIYKEEKLSALMPFENVASILTIVAAFFLFGDTPVATLVIAIFTVALIFVVTFDFKRRQFPKNISLILLANGISAARTLMIGYALVQLTSPTFYSVRAMIISAFAFLPILYFRQYGRYFEGDKEYLAPRLGASFLGAVSALIAFTLVAELGVVTTTLLGFFSMGSTLLFSRFYLGERPEKKHLFLVFAVTSLVAFGTYFRIA